MFASSVQSIHHIQLAHILIYIITIFIYQVLSGIRQEWEVRAWQKMY